MDGVELAIRSHLETHVLTQKDISEWDIVKDSGKDRYIDSHNKTRTYIKAYFRLGYSHGRW